MSINQDTGSREVAITDTDRLETLSNLIQKLVKEKKEPNLDLVISNEETLETVIPLQKKKKTTESEVPKLKLTTTQQLKKRNNWIL